MAYSTAIIFAILSALAEVEFGTVDGHSIVYVDTENGTLNNSCWKGGPDLPCRSLELGLEGAKRHDTKVAILVNRGAIFSNTTVRIKNADNDSNSYSMGCPPWLVHSPSGNGTCECSNTSKDIVRCNESLQESSILDGYCMTYSESTGTVMGACLYGFVPVRPKNADPLYTLLPHTTEELNNATCGRFGRDGQLCGRCKPGYHPLVYSVDVRCMKCSDSRYAWIKYIAVAYIPLTVFFLLVTCFRIRATSPKLYAFVTFSQTCTLHPFVHTFRFQFQLSIPTQILVTLYGIWNLDFFRMVLPQLCLKVNTLQSLALDYTISFYPLVLLLITYFLIKLHDNFQFSVRLWRPFHRCFARFQREWNVKTSVIDAFATFLFLSSTRLLNVSFDLLVPTRVYYQNGSVVGLFLFYDATIEYFGREHLPYAILALVILLIFVLLPLLLLLLYPMRCFQGRCGVRWLALHIFMDAFQGCYKDGTNGTRDCRYFSALHLILRIALLTTYAITHTNVFDALALVIVIVFAMLNAVIQPYKQEHSIYNVTDTVLVLILALLYAVYLGNYMAALRAHTFQGAMSILLVVVAVLPLFYISFIVLHWLAFRCEIGQKYVSRFQVWIKRIFPNRNMTQSVSEESLPDRLLNTVEYGMNSLSPEDENTEGVENHSSGEETTY